MLKKVTVGFVVQTFDPYAGKFVSQEFVAGDEVTYENEMGDVVDEWEEYLPFNMVQPEPSGFDIDIVVEAMGHFTQTIRVTDPDWSPADIIATLHEGRIATTIQEGGDVSDVATGRVIAIVTNVDNHLEYSEFELKG